MRPEPERDPQVTLGEDELVERLADDDASAFADVFDTYAPLVYRYITRRVGTGHAEDLLSQTFLAALEHRSRFDSRQGSVRGWLLGIATNMVRAHLRTVKRDDGLRLKAIFRRERPIDDVDQIIAKVDADSAGSRLTGAVMALSPGDRDVLLLFAWEDLSYAEIAQVLEIPVGTVRSRLNRARQQVRSATSEAMEEGEQHGRG
ncbi:sigma-70 family RNA polymerase sigma factor [Nocardioides sp. BE266]|uniref:RNA polymerase sigma factor n=1 Tax=Nocardioides sp. BE266 TaxID=2817725 RepID=UPI002869FF04|nr:sigma-70 family RNA polymerase sigma factor [Nocardioides sp. BE266]